MIKCADRFSISYSSRFRPVLGLIAWYSGAVALYWVIGVLLLGPLFGLRLSPNWTYLIILGVSLVVGEIVRIFAASVGPSRMRFRDYCSAAAGGLSMGLCWYVVTVIVLERHPFPLVATTQGEPYAAVVPLDLLIVCVLMATLYQTRNLGSLNRETR